MGKRYKVFCLNGPNRGKEIEVEADYAEEQEEELKNKQAFIVDGTGYAGYCRMCGAPVREDEADYQFNTNSYGSLRLDIHHRRCL
ncbi:MAG: hypothetical protein E7231_00285 [Cellulosilyticum sp.]|nr:hypothetical protein [Cellulosilyticum sp.]